MANLSNTQCPWKKFYTNTLKYMDSLHAETCQPQMKIAKFVVAARQHFASLAMKPKGSKKSTEQLEEKMENPIYSIKNGTADNRHSCWTTATKCKNRSPTQHPRKHNNTSCNSLPIDGRTSHIDTIQPSLQEHFKCITRPSNDNHAKPSLIPILQNNKSNLDDTSGYESTDMELSATTTPKTHNAMHPRPSTRNNQPKVQQITSSLPRPCKENTTKQLQTTSPTMWTGKHLSYQHHQHKADKHSLQDHH